MFSRFAIPKKKLNSFLQHSIFKIPPSKMSSLITIDGHFWVVRDGKVIDPDFAEYDQIKRIQGCAGNAVYQPADDITQRVIIGKYEKKYGMKATGRMMLLFGVKRRAYACYQNAVMEITENGGELVFGSMGWKKRNGTIHYEFGGDGWKVHQFLK